jgi:hypothetical protein
MVETLTLLPVYYMPQDLEPGILYYSAEFRVAGHLCPCGCGNKVITPIGPTDWSFSETNGQATLEPSLGNWQLPCRSHYWVRKARIVWAALWTDKQIKAGRKKEEKKRKAYFQQLERKPRKRKGLWGLVDWLFA